MAEKYRNEDHQVSYQTKIFREYPSGKNPYCETDVECYGYRQIDLADNLDFTEYLFLLLRGRLPEQCESRLLSKLLISLSSPGVRHPATRAAVAAGVGKALPENVLPTALLVLNGEIDGAANVQASMRFLRQAKRAKSLHTYVQEKSPGFGEYYGGVNSYLDRVCEALLDGEDWQYLNLGKNIIAELQKNKSSNCGWQLSGLFAAVFCDLGVHPRLAPGLMQIVNAPALLVQGMENANKPTTVLPFVKDKDYEIKK